MRGTDERLRLGTQRRYVGYFVEVDARGMATTETALDLCIFNAKLLQYSDNLRSDDRKRPAAGRRDAEQTLEENRLHFALSFTRIRKLSSSKVLVCLFWHKGLAIITTPSPPSLNTLAASVTERLRP
jgi:hypothetical protein